MLAICIPVLLGVRLSFAGVLLGDSRCSHLIAVHDLTGVELLSCLDCLAIHSLFRVVDLRGSNCCTATLAKLLKLLLRLYLTVSDKLGLASLKLLIV